ncbi:MAG: aldo/keto reductase [Dehalococcoidales bacterium]|nr:aldo/keto reductase [Dehalococcoidales bacterium]
MEYTTLGRTGLKVTRMGLGCGGPSRIGKGTGKTEDESVAIIRRAIDAGINIIDSAEIYRTEDLVGQAIRGLDRTSLVLCTKKTPSEGLTGEQLRQGLEDSLKRLGTDYVDVYYLHGVVLKDYEYLVTEIVPEMQKLRQEGKLRFIGISEMFNADTRHEMFQRAFRDDCWDVMMVGFNLLNQSAREYVFPETVKKNIGTTVMFPVRLALSRKERLKEVMNLLIEKGQVNPDEFDMDDPLGFLIHEGGAVSIPDAAYRFCHYESGPNVILSGTGNITHLEENLESFNRPPLPEEDVEKLKYLFRNVDSVTGQ